VTYVYTDPQGTPLAEADAQGNIVARYDYTPYGNSVASLGSPPNGPGYTGHVNDPETGLVYMQARYYQLIGRFLSPDPEGPTPGNVFDFNRYSYVDNNPITHTDPTGRQCTQCLYSPNDSLEHQATILQTADARALEGTAGLIPVVGTVLSVYQATKDPTALNISTAVVSAVPEVGGVASKAIKEVAQVEKAAASTEKGLKAFSSQKQALVDMAKADKRTGMTSADMQAYKDLNNELPDPFPANKVRGPEAHPSGAPTSQQPHGHVGPIDHIPIKDSPQQ